MSKFLFCNFATSPLGLRADETCPSGIHGNRMPNGDLPVVNPRLAMAFDLQRVNYVPVSSRLAKERNPTVNPVVTATRLKPINRTKPEITSHSVGR